jgi:hypothetical protein
MTGPWLAGGCCTTRGGGCVYIEHVVNTGIEEDFGNGFETKFGDAIEWNFENRPPRIKKVSA